MNLIGSMTGPVRATDCGCFTWEQTCVRSNQVDGCPPVPWFWIASAVVGVSLLIQRGKGGQ